MLNRIILGTIQLGQPYGINNKLGQPTVGQSIQLLKHAYNKGIRRLDTAEVYGSSHLVIGLFHKEYDDCKFEVISKINKQKLKKTGNLQSLVKQDIVELQVNQLQGYMFHSYDDFSLFTELHSEIIKLKDEGLIKEIGISLYTNEEIEQIIGIKWIDFIQVPFNVLDNYALRGRLLQNVADSGKDIHIRSVFLQGLLFKNLDTITGKLLPVKKYLNRIHQFCRIKNLSIERLAMSYVFCHDFVKFALIGAETNMQLDRNLKILDNLISNKEFFKEIDLIRVTESQLLNPSKWE